MKERFTEFKKRDDVALVTVHTENSGDKAPEFVADQGIEYPVAIDDAGKTVAKYKITGFPTYVIIGKDGKVFHPDAWPPDKVDGIVKEALAEEVGE